MLSGRTQQFASVRPKCCGRRPIGRIIIVLDDDVVLSGTILSDAIIFDISNDDDNNVGEDDGNSGDDMNETPLLCPSNTEVGETLNKFHNLSLFRNLW